MNRQADLQRDMEARSAIDGKPIGIGDALAIELAGMPPTASSDKPIARMMLPSPAEVEAEIGDLEKRLAWLRNVRRFLARME